jgi:ADP-heptose:LPS heptosyltransferase
MTATVDLGSQQRIVIYRLGSLGDTVVALPCFHKVAQTWPDAERIVLTNFPVSSKAAPLEVILREGGLIHSAIAYPVGTRSIAALLRLAGQLRGLNADVLVYLTPARGLLTAVRDWMFFKFCGFRHIVGAPLSEDLQKCREIAPAAAGQPRIEERECERLARCLARLGPIDLSDPEMWELHLSKRELAVGDEVLGPLGASPYLAINMGGKAKEKDWGLGNWRMLLETLSEHYPGDGLLIIGAAEDSQRAQDIAVHWHGPVVDACGRLSPRESAAAMRHAEAFIGHDSGPLHLAAAAGVRCVGLFGDINQPQRWHPPGSRHRIIHRMSGLQSITVTEVVSAVRDIAPRRQACA